jgi:hypothetical protein
MLYLARQGRGEVQAWPGAGLSPTRPAIFHAGSCLGWANFVVLQTDLFSPTGMAEYSGFFNLYFFDVPTIFYEFWKFK